MAKQNSIWLVVVLAAWAFAIAADAAASDCPLDVFGMLGCVDYVAKGSHEAVPRFWCCVGVAKSVRVSPQCFCDALHEAESMVDVNMTRGQDLPKVCRIPATEISCGVPSPSPASSPEPTNPVVPTPSPKSPQPPPASLPNPPTPPPSPTFVFSVKRSPSLRKRKLRRGDISRWIEAIRDVGPPPSPSPLPSKPAPSPSPSPSEPAPSPSPSPLPSEPAPTPSPSPSEPAPSPTKAPSEWSPPPAASPVEAPAEPPLSSGVRKLPVSFKAIVVALAVVACSYLQF